VPGWPKVAVVGGSLGGATTGLVLRDVGCDVHVFERSRSPLQERGAGIAVLDITIRYLVEHDIVNLGDICTSTHWLRYLQADGSVQYEEQRRYRFSSWNSIYRALIGCLSEERYHLGTEVVGFGQDGRSVTVRFADGSTGSWDMLVGADGIGSTVRHILLPKVEPHYAGYVGWRGTVTESLLSSETFRALDDSITYQLLPRSHILVYPIPSQEGAVGPGRRLMNFVWYRNVAGGAELEALMTDREGELRASSLPPGAVQERFVEEIRDFAAARMAPPIAEVVLRTEKPFVQVIFDLEVSTMAIGRVCLVGDAAFAARPHAAAGTAKAAANAWALAEAMAGAHGDVEHALQNWEPHQLALGRNLVERARDIGNRSQFESRRWLPGDPSLIFGLYGPGR
jgi:2,6-dihydroxypyridine 3-monooxygenase